MLRDELSRGTAMLAAAGADTPRLDAELLLADVLGIDRAELIMRARDEPSEDALEEYQARLARRARREPVAYILGRRGFRRLWLAVDRRVLIPRPESELLVEVGLELASGARVADVGTGSGAVALALKDERPDLDVTGLDVSSDALDVARGNAQRLGLDVRFVQSDLLDSGRYDAVVANLPYVPLRSPLAPEIIDWEPAGAVFGGPDGLEQVRRLVAAVKGRPEVELLALEIGFDQAMAVSELVAAAGFAEVERRRDLAGHERVVVGRR